MFELVPHDIRDLHDLYACQAVCEDGYFLNTRSGRCSLHVSPQTIKSAITVLDLLVNELRRRGGTVKLEMSSDLVPYVYLHIGGEDVPLVIKETNLSIVESSSAAFRVVSKVDHGLSGKLKLSCRIEGRYMYWYIDDAMREGEIKVVAKKILEKCSALDRKV